MSSYEFKLMDLINLIFHNFFMVFNLLTHMSQMAYGIWFMESIWEGFSDREL